MEKMKDIEECENLSDMIIFHDKEIITMKDFYEKFEQIYEKMLEQKDKISKDSPFEIQISSKTNAKITHLDRITFSFIYLNIYKEGILNKPIKTFIDIKTCKKSIELISLRQINNIAKKYNIKNPSIYCDCKNSLPLTYRDLFYHKPHNFKIYDAFIISEIKDEEQFNNYFVKEKSKFNNILEFEKNFNNYFNKKGTIRTDTNFEYYDNVQRDLLYNDFWAEANFGNKFTIFGDSGIGKSISTLYIIKYKLEHDKYKVLYIHCKYLKLLEAENNYDIIRQRLIDEIPYLFYGDFSSYKICCGKIKDFEFNSSNTIFSLVEKLLDYIIEQKQKDKKYIICFDQYNESCDPKGKIKEIVRKVLNNEDINKNFLFVCLESMNNTDVKLLKIKKLLKAKDSQNGIVTEYINDFSDLKFKNNKYEHYFQKLGKNIKTYMELSLIKESELEKYYDNKKIEYEKKITKYFNGNNDDSSISYGGMKKLLSFIVNTNYKQEELMKIINDIPFKYFKVDLDKDTNDSEFKITYLSPIIEEVIKNIYYKFIYNNDKLCLTLMNQKGLIEGGSRGCLFEQYIINKLTPIKNTINAPIPDIVINEKRTIPKFIPKTTEKNIHFDKDKIKLLSKNIYLIEQEVFGGKSIDFVIIDFTGDEPIFFAFQVGIIKDTIFTIEYIKETLIKMREYLNNFFDNLELKDNNLYFGYIFSLLYKKNQDYPKFDTRFNTMIKNCLKNGVAYSFYDMEKNIFTNERKKIIKSIYEMTICPFVEKISFKIPRKSFGFGQVVKKNKTNKYEIPIRYKNKIIPILRNVYKTKIDEFKYSQTLNKRFIYSTYYGFYFVKDGHGNSYIIINSLLKYSIYSLDKINSTIERNKFFDGDFIADCYDIFSNKKKINSENYSFEEMNYKNVNLQIKKKKKNK